VALDKRIQANSDKKPTVGNRADSNKLADKEETILKEAELARKLLEGEGSAVAFAEVFEQVSKDMLAVKKRLDKAITDDITVTTENDIIETLKEMIEALKKAQKDSKPGKSKPGKGGKPPDPKLIDLLAELKMIYAMQRRVNNRTAQYGAKYKGEQLAPPQPDARQDARDLYKLIKEELGDLSKRQQKIGKVTRDIATGKNEAK
jgi:hypothetical protein